MCGITVIASPCIATDSPPCVAGAEFLEALSRRGPDLPHGSCVIQSGAARLSFSGSLLQLRGLAAQATPLRDPSSGALLVWNGEVFSGIPVQLAANDSAAVLEALTRPGACVPEVLSSIRGPWALVFWQPSARTLWFGRDVVGRRSLLLHLPSEADSRLIITSVGPPPPNDFLELAPGLYSIAFPVDDSISQPASYTAHAWTDPQLLSLSAFQRLPDLVHPTQEEGGVPCSGSCHSSSGQAGSSEAVDAAADLLLSALRRSVATRCCCMDWAASNTTPTHRLLGRERLKQPPTESAPAPEAGDFCCVAAQGPATSPPAAAQADLQPAPVLILFSGGADSTLMAALAHEALPPEVPIDLSSICFDEGRSPDRLAALDALQELRAISPGRVWRLIQVNCSLADVEAHREWLMQLLAPSNTCMDLNIGAALWLATRASGVLYEGDQMTCSAGPGNGCCAPGSGAGEAPPTKVMLGHGGAAAGSGGGRAYTSQARVVLLGHGADELLGGYSRHRTRFRAGGWEGLAAELALDMGRLWQRNLGRDDRLVADHGREARHPYLAEDVIATALSLPLHQVADLRLPPGQGDKLVLRRCLLRLGLPRAAARVKRAIQFGSRIGQKSNLSWFGGTRHANRRHAGTVKLTCDGLGAQPD